MPMQQQVLAPEVVAAAQRQQQAPVVAVPVAARRQQQAPARAQAMQPAQAPLDWRCRP
ncbi:MAG: hypothetical protein JO055_05730 [Alphaproteobacteria bacterium]|nr:hypothetical protein [Alphaproteobacteria bacterium]